MVLTHWFLLSIKKSLIKITNDTHAKNEIKNKELELINQIVNKNFKYMKVHGKNMK